MQEMSDIRFASKMTATRIYVLTSMYIKTFNAKMNDIATYVDHFELLFSELERKGSETEIPDSYKAPPLLANIGNNLPLNGTVEALRIRNTDKMTCKDVKSDIIQEWNQIRNGQRSDSTHDTRNGQKFNQNSFKAPQLKTGKGRTCEF